MLEPGRKQNDSCILRRRSQMGLVCLQLQAHDRDYTEKEKRGNYLEGYLLIAEEAGIIYCVKGQKNTE